MKAAKVVVLAALHDVSATSWDVTATLGIVSAAQFNPPMLCVPFVSVCLKDLDDWLSINIDNRA